jgi:hypothetical protein
MLRPAIPLVVADRSKPDPEPTTERPAAHTAAHLVITAYRLEPSSAEENTRRHAALFPAFSVLRSTPRPCEKRPEDEYSAWSERCFATFLDGMAFHAPPVGDHRSPRLRRGATPTSRNDGLPRAATTASGRGESVRPTARSRSSRECRPGSEACTRWRSSRGSPPQRTDRPDPHRSSNPGRAGSPD